MTRMHTTVFAVVVGLLLTAHPAFAGPSTCTWKTSDIIDKRIDVGAQKSLMRMMSRGGEDQKRASAMIYAVKRKLIDGIYLPPRGPVVKRGKAMRPQKGYWQIIPRGKDSVCLKQPRGFKPVMVYREKMSNARVDAALKSAFDACKLPLPKACDYKADRWKPKPKPKKQWFCQYKKSCTRDSQCRGLPPDSMGSTTHMCFRGECCGKGTPPPPQKKKRFRCTEDFAWMQCPIGYFCRRGICVDGGKRSKCEDDALAKEKRERRACESQHRRDLAFCVPTGADPRAAASFTLCTAKARNKMEKCNRRAWDKKENTFKRCKTLGGAIKSSPKKSIKRAPRRTLKRRR